MTKSKPIIICIVGESGVGKSYVADILDEFYGIPMIESRTTRPPRTPDERGHMFVSDDEFDTYKIEDMIAQTTFGEFRYCCLIKDVNAPIMVYVIDEYGLDYLRHNFSSRFNIFAVRIFSPERLRKNRVTKARMKRDKNKFTMLNDCFDYFIENTYDEKDIRQKVTKLVLRVEQKFI